MNMHVDDRNVEDRIATWLDDIEVKAQGFNDEADRDARLGVSWERAEADRIARAADCIHQIFDKAVMDAREVLSNASQDAAA